MTTIMTIDEIYKFFDRPNSPKYPPILVNTKTLELYKQFYEQSKQA